MNTQNKLTGYPSIDKPWLSKYPHKLLDRKTNVSISIAERIKAAWNNSGDKIIHYYGTDISSEDFFNNVETVAKSLTTLGIKANDAIVVSLEATPEFIYLLLACEILGCVLKNYIGSAEEVVRIINKGNIMYYFVHDYVSTSYIDTIYNSTAIKNIILIDPLQSVACKDNVRGNILLAIHKRYSVKSDNIKNLAWSNFLSLGDTVCYIPANFDCKRKLFCAFTSGTTGAPKEVIHSSETMLGVINQLALYPANPNKRDSWLLTILPPTLVATVVAFILYPLVDGKRLILDPFCPIDDIDLEMMYYEPQCWGLIPMFFNVLLKSKRILDNYDMSYFKLFGFGAEAVTAKFVNKVQKFLEKHNCKAPLSSGYGQSEGGSDFTVAIGGEMMNTGTAGIPLINTTLSIFVPGTDTELQYYQVGEICKTGPGVMLGYFDEQLTSTVIKTHSDGNMWLHTGDYGYMTEDGLLFYLGRDKICVYPGKDIFGVNIENKILSLPEIDEAIIVSGLDKSHDGYEVPYLFVIPEKEDFSTNEVVTIVKDYITQNLSKEEQPREVFVIDKKPYNKFKTDRRWLQKEYGLI